MKRGSVVVPANPARKVKFETEPATKRKPSLRPTRCKVTSTVASLEPVTPQYAEARFIGEKLPVVSGP